MREVKAPGDYSHCVEPRVFLAGSIEMGKAEDWQVKVAESLGDMNVAVLNPRRDDFDPKAKQEIENDYFRGQVNWELDALGRSDVIFMYFSPGTYSPITLMELGLHVRSGRIVVCCPPGYWRKGNVDILCSRYNVAVHTDIDSAVEELRGRLAR